MAKKKKAKTVYRYYEIPHEMPLLALLCEQFEKNIEDEDSAHAPFHKE